MGAKTKVSEADLNTLADMFPTGFEVEPTTVDVGRGAERDPKGCIVTRTGLIRFNMSGGEEVSDQVRVAGFENHSECGFVWAFNEKTLEIAGKVVGPKVPGVTPIRLHAKTQTFRAYLKGLFKSKPAAAPNSTRWVPISRLEDPKRGTFLILNMSLAVQKAKKSRGSGESNSSAKPSEPAAAPKAEPQPSAKPEQ
jgi:hypothetical protein